jgi:hypothetical protein
LSRFFTALFALSLLFLCPLVKAQENPYFVTYDHNLEEPATSKSNISPPSARSAPEATFTPFGWSSNTA